MKKLKFYIVHCSATQPTVEVTPELIRLWHTAPAEIKDTKGKITGYKYKGVVYKDRNSLPNDFINGQSVRKSTGRGWSTIGYSDLINLGGKLINLTPYDDDDDVEAWEITNGVAGINSISRHIVYAGGIDKAGKPKDTRNPYQLLTLENTIKQTVNTYPKILIGGHNQFDKGKACPSFDVPKYLKSIGISDVNIYKG